MKKIDVTGVTETLKKAVAEDIAFRKARREDYQAIVPALERLAEATRTPEGTPFICSGVNGGFQVPTFIYFDLRGPRCGDFRKDASYTCQAANPRGQCPFYKKS